MYAEAVLRAAGREFAQEHHAVVDLLDRDVEVGHAGVCARHVVKFVVVCGKECLGVYALMLVDVFDDRPGDGDTVVGRGASSKLVEQYE